MGNVNRHVTTVLAGFVLLAVAAQAADINQVMANTESRRRAAENGLKDIKAKGEPSGDVRDTYAAAAAATNTWLDSVCQAIERGSASAPDVSASAQQAADSLVAWVNVRNRILGVPEVAGTAVDVVKKSVTQDLTAIAETTWKANRSADAKKRGSAVNALKERLRWKAFDEI